MSGSQKRNRRNRYVYNLYLPRVLDLVKLLWKLGIRMDKDLRPDRYVTSWDTYCGRYYEKRRRAQKL